MSLVILHQKRLKSLRAHIIGYVPENDNKWFTIWCVGSYVDIILQNILTILGSIVNTIQKTLIISYKELKNNIHLGPFASQHSFCNLKRPSLLFAIAIEINPTERIGTHTRVLIYLDFFIQWVLLMPTRQLRMCTCKESGLKVLPHCLYQDNQFAIWVASSSSWGLEVIRILYVIGMLEHLH